MKIGFCTINYSEKNLEEVFNIAASNGYEAVELPAYTDNGQVDVDEALTPEGAKRLKKMAAEAGLVISGISNHADSPLVLGPHGRDLAGVHGGGGSEQIAFGTASMLRCAQLAHMLEVPAVVAFSGVGNFGHFNDWPYPNGWPEEEEAFVRYWIPIFDKYKEYGVKVAFEPHPNNIIYDYHTTARCLKLCDGHAAFAINFDPANLFYTGIDLGAYIQAFGDRIVLAHAKDCEFVPHNMARGGLWMLQRDWGARDRSFRFRIPGWGSINWKSVITELYMAGYDGVLSYEHEDVTMSRADGVEKTIDFLRPLMIHAPYEGRSDKLFQF
ncbi:MAG: sugar phosphate isomerase/epimerase [Clostridiales bacterium]|jgi:sugar phosphate isomerase/epimerase|nr:sugar phosphate isomerase/epimerase [Clostridiales bacterium]